MTSSAAAPDAPPVPDVVARHERYQARSAELQARLASLAERQRARPRPARPTTHQLRVLNFAPHEGQRRVLRSPASEWVLITGRQWGKTMLAIYATVRVALGEPGSYSVLLAPTFPIARNAVDKMREACRAIPGCRWREQQKRMVFPNGSVWQVFSADRKETVRGPTLNGILWVDEAALVDGDAWTTALGALTAVKNPRKLLTTTPLGKNWVYDVWSRRKRRRASFRCRSTDSPLANHEEITEQRDMMSPEKFAQEYLAEFVDDLLLAFPDLSDLFRSSFPDRRRERDLRVTMGVDLGKDQDWTVCTTVNKFGEARIVGRWQHASWTETEPKILELIKRHGVELVCLDVSGLGSYLHDRLTNTHKIRVLPVKTHLTGAKAEVVELARAEVQARRVWVRYADDHSDVPDCGCDTCELTHELKRFQGKRFVLHGTEYMRYEGMQAKGEHDDCVISLCLALWGREKGWTTKDPLAGDFSGFAADAPLPAERDEDLGDWAPL